MRITFHLYINGVDNLRQFEEGLIVRDMKKTVLLLAIFTLVLSLLVGCGKGNEGSTTAPGTTTPAEVNVDLKGDVIIAGSSTVYPVTVLAAESFMDENPDVNISIASTGTGGGFKKWVIGETDINNASSKIKDEQVQEAAKNGIEAVELTVAYDGITIIVNKDNDFVDYLTTDELKKIWEPDSKVKTWADVRAGWPDKPIKLYGPSTDHGTFEFFTEKIVGTAMSSRTDYSPAGDYNILVQGVSGDKYSLGYLGYAYYIENTDKLKDVPVAQVVKDGSGNVTEVKTAVSANMDTIGDGSYKPLGREIWIYVSNKSLEKPQVAAFVKYYMEHAAEFSKEAGYIPLPADYAKKEQDELASYIK